MLRRLYHVLFSSLAVVLVATSVLVSSPTSANAAIVNDGVIGGLNRFATAEKVAGAMVSRTGGSVVLATGANFPDALAAGPVAAKLEAPILLTMPQRIPEETKTALERQKPSRVIVVGGEKAVSSSIMGELKSILPGAQVQRFGGANRHETAGKLATTFFPNASAAFIATGWNFPDALTAGAAAAHLDAPILLGHSRGLTNETKTALVGLSNVTRVYLAGGEQVLKYDIGGYSVRRIAGKNRFETNAKIVDMFYGSATHKVYVAAADKFPDALVATPLAAKQRAPLLLSRNRCTDASSRQSAQRLLALNPFNEDVMRREVVRIGLGIGEHAVLTECGNSVRAPWNIMRPAGITDDDITPNEIYNFVVEYNRIRVDHGLYALPVSRFRVGINEYSRLSQRHADAQGALPPHQGAINGNEVVAASGSLVEQYFEFGAVHSLRMWWNSLAHQKILFQPTGSAGYGGPGVKSTCLVFNITRTRETSNKGWDSFSDARASWGSCDDIRTVPATSVDLRLRSYRMPSVAAGATYKPSKQYDATFRVQQSAWEHYLSGYTFDEYIRRRG